MEAFGKRRTANLIDAAPELPGLDAGEARFRRV